MATDWFYESGRDLGITSWTQDFFAHEPSL